MSAETLRAKIREIPDFPKPGILFYDITTLLKDPAAYTEAIDLMLEPYRDEQRGPRGGHGVARLHLLGADGVPAGHRPGAGPQAGQAAGRDADRGVRARVRLQHARDPPRRDPARPAGADRGRPPRHRRHRARHDRARSSASRAWSSASRSSSSSTSSRVASASRAARSRASSSTDGRRERPGSHGRHDRAMTDRPAEPPDPTRRRFFRQFAGDVVTSVGSVLGAAQVLQQQSAEAARSSSAPPSRWPPPVAAAAGRRPRRPRARRTRRAPATAPRSAGTATSAASSTSAGCRTSWPISRSARRRPRQRDQRRRADRRRRPGAGGRGDAGAGRRAMRWPRGRSPGAPRSGAPPTPCGSPRPGSAALGLARRPAGWRSSSPWATEADGETVLGGAARGGRGDPRGGPGGPRAPSWSTRSRRSRARRTSRSTCSRPAAPGRWAAGMSGTALSVIMALHHAGRPVHALVAETRPLFEGSRVAAWELRQAGVPHAVVTDAAAPGCIAAGEVGVVLVAADRVAANGDVIAIAGTYPLALAAAAAGVPFLVCAPTYGAGPATCRTAAPRRSRRAARAPSCAPPGRGSRPRARRSATRSRTSRRPRWSPRSSPRRACSARRIGPAIAAAVAAARRHGGPRPGFAALVAQARSRPPRRGRRPGRGRRGRPPSRGRRLPTVRAGSARRGLPPTRRPGRAEAALMAAGRRRTGAAPSSSGPRGPGDPARGFLERDRLFAAYALCDLEDREFGRTRWGIATAGDEIVAVGMEYSGPTPQPMFLMGQARRDRRDPARRGPAARRVRVGRVRVPARRRPPLPGGARARRWSGCGWTGRRSSPFPASVERLLPVEVDELNRLYQLGFAAWLPSDAVAEGDLLRHPGERPPRRRRRDPRHLAGRPARRRRQRPDPRRSPRSRATRRP